MHDCTWVCVRTSGCMWLTATQTSATTPHGLAADRAVFHRPGCPSLTHSLLPDHQAREAELSEMLASTQSSLQAMQRLYGTAQNQLFELQSNKEAAVVVKQVRHH